MHERLINHLFEDKGDRAMVTDLVRSLPTSMREDRVERLLHELAQPVPDGMTEQQSVDWIASFLDADGIGNEGQAFLNWIDAAAPTFGELPHEALINSLWQAEDRRAEARHFVDQWPGLDDDRLVAILRRGAENDRKVETGQMTLEQSRADVAALLRDGAPADVSAKIGDWFERTPTADEPAHEGDTAPSPPPSAPAPDRAAAAKADITRFETMMRDAPREYWNTPSNQQAYRDALTVLHGGGDEP